MCLIIHQKTGDRLTRDEVADIYHRNRDGFGVMWIENDTVKTWKALPASADDAWIAYEWIAGHEAILHWRMCTHGVVSHDNAHPHVVHDGKVALVHNGVFSQFGRDPVKSDTVEFVETIRPFITSHDVLIQPDVLQYLEQAVTGSSVVFGTPQGFTRIGRQGVTIDGRWYSNTYAWSAPRHLTPHTYGRTRASAAPSFASTGVKLADGSWRFSSQTYDDDVNDAFDAASARLSKAIEFDEEKTLTDGSWVDLCLTLAQLMWDVGEDDVGDLVYEATDDPTSTWIVDEAIDMLQACCSPGYRLELQRDTLRVVEDWRSYLAEMQSDAWGE